MKLSRINTGLLVAIVVVNAITIALPLAPAVTFWARGRFSDVEEKLTQQLHIPAVDLPQPREDARPANRLVIPAMLLDEEIHEGATARTLREGPWRRPHTSTPGNGSNTVISAHRFTYTDPQASFYHLDKLREDDEVGIFWEGKRYIYKVVDIQITGPDETSVESPTDKPTLTLYTCTPLWLPKDRLVVTAQLVEEN